MTTNGATNGTYRSSGGRGGRGTSPVRGLPTANLSAEHLDALADMVHNALSSRTDWFMRQGGGRSNPFDPRRSIDDECGFPSDTVLDCWRYNDLYRRDALARRVVEVYPKETWQVQPKVYEAEAGDVVTPFEKAWDEVGRGLRGEGCYFAGEQGSPVMEALARLDIQCGIGRYGVLLLGLDDGLDPSKPAKGITEEGSLPKKVKPKGTPRTEGDDAGADDGTPAAASTRNAFPPPYRLTWNLVPSPASAVGEDEEDDNLDPTDDAEDLGLDDEDQLETEEGEPEQEFKAANKLIYLRVFPEHLAQVVAVEGNRNSPRYGWPTMYSISLTDPADAHGATTFRAGLPPGEQDNQYGSYQSVMVHWTRVIHVADNIEASEPFGDPRLHPVLNDLLTAQKPRWASGEGYWKAHFTWLFLQNQPQLGGDVIPPPKSELRDMLENWMNSLQRANYIGGLNAQAVAPTISDPNPFVESCIATICIRLGCPIRIFKGSERGELASSQDDKAWNDRLSARQWNFVTPRILVPFVDRLISLGVLPVPSYKEPPKEVPDQAAIDDPVKGATALAKPPEPKEASPFGPPAAPAPNGPPRPLKAPLGNAFPPPKGKPPGPPKPVGGAPTPPGDPPGGGKTGGPPGAPAAPPAMPKQLVPKDAAERKANAPVGYKIEWPDLTSQSDEEEARVFSARMTAFGAALSGGVTDLIPPHELLTLEAGYTDEEATMILTAAEEFVAAKDVEAQAKQIEQIEAGLAPDPAIEQEIKMEQAKNGPPPGPPGAGPPSPFGGPPGSAPPGKKPNPFAKNQAATDNAFCPTGKGGGSDPSCSPGGGSASSAGIKGKVKATAAAVAAKILETHSSLLARVEAMDILPNRERFALDASAGGRAGALGTILQHTVGLDHSTATAAAAAVLAATPRVAAQAKKGVEWIRSRMAEKAQAKVREKHERRVAQKARRKEIQETRRRTRVHNEYDHQDFPGYPANLDLE